MDVRRVFRALRRFSFHGFYPKIIEGHLVVATLDLLWRESPEWLRTLVGGIATAAAAVLVCLADHPAWVLGGLALAAVCWVGTTLARHGRILLTEFRKLREDMRGVTPHKRSGTPKAIVTRVRGTERKTLPSTPAKKNKKTGKPATMPNETWTGPAVTLVSLTSASGSQMHQTIKDTSASKLKGVNSSRKPPKRAASRDQVKVRPFRRNVGA